MSTEINQANENILLHSLLHPLATDVDNAAKQDTDIFIQWHYPPPLPNGYIACQVPFVHFHSGTWTSHNTHGTNKHKFFTVVKEGDVPGIYPE
jgi:hypothetical protein